MLQLFISPAKTTIFTFLEVIFIHCIYSSSYPKKKQRKDPAKSLKKKFGKRKVLAHCLLMSDHFATVHCKNTRVIRLDPQLVHKLFSLHNMDLMVNYVEKLIQYQCRELVQSTDNRNQIWENERETGEIRASA